MSQYAEEHRQQQGAGHPQADRASMVKHQDPGRKQESRSRQAVAVPKKALEQQRQPVDKNGADPAVADHRTQGQHQQHHAPDLPADGLLLGLGRLSGTGGSSLCGRTFSFCGGFLLRGGCHGMYLLTGSLGHNGQKQSRRAGKPAVVGKPAKTALGGDHLQKPDAGIAHHGGHRHAHQIHRHGGPVDTGLHSVFQAQDVGAQDGGNGKQEGKAHGELALKAHKAAGGDGGAGPGDAGAGGDGLGNAHDQHIDQRGAALRLAAMADPVTGKEQAAGDQQRAGHEIHVVAQAFHQILHRQHQKQRQRAHDDEQDHPAGGRDGIRRVAAGQIPHAAYQLQDHVTNIGPVSHKHRHQGAQVEQYIEKVRDLRGTGHIQKVLCDGQMAGAGDRQELRDTLDQAQENRGQKGQSAHAP